MDFSRFSHDDFEVKSWVNGALEAYKDSQTSLDAHASSLVMKLQLFIQEVNQGLEEVSGDMLNSLPRVLRDLEAVRQEASLLRKQMQVVKEDIKKVERDTAASMSCLVELDEVKTRMESSLQALQEADNWTSLAADVDIVFQSQDINLMAQKLAGMEQSLHVLHDVPDFEERHQFLESLKNKFEASLSPRLVAAFDDHATEEASMYVSMCVAMGRAAQVQNYYIGCHKKVIVQQWQEVHSSSDSLAAALSTLYQNLLTKWREEFSWCSRIGLDPVQVLPVLFCQALEALTPPLVQCLQEAVRSSDTPLSLLLQLRQMCLQFLRGMRGVVEEGEKEGACQGEALLELVGCVHGPYCQSLVRYPAMETQMLKQQLLKIDLNVVVGVEEGVARMCDSASRVFQCSSEALEHCLQLTSGWGYHGLQKALQTFFAQYTNTLSSNIHQLRRGCGVGVAKGEGGKGVAMGGEEEWAVLQQVFQLIQLSGDLLMRTHTLSQECHASLTQVAVEMLSPSSAHAPFNTYDYLAVYHQEERTATMAILDNLQRENSEDVSWVLPGTVWSQLQALNEQCHAFAFDILFQPLRKKLERVPHLQEWSGTMNPLDSPRALSSEGLPQFSLSPLPYITEIGDYLLTLPRQLEPFTSQDSVALRHALRLGKLPFSEGKEVGRGMVVEEEDGEGHPSDDWLGAVSRGTMETYCKYILLIPALSPAAASQLTTDIAYLSNVLTALGQMPSEQLMELETLLKPMSQSEYEQLKGTSSLHHSVGKVRTWD